MEPTLVSQKTSFVAGEKFAQTRNKKTQDLYLTMAESVDSWYSELTGQAVGLMAWPNQIAELNFFFLSASWKFGPQTTTMTVTYRALQQSGV